MRKIISHSGYRCSQHVKHGITLVEILVTLVILGVLTAIITPVYINTMDSAERIQCSHQLQSIGNAMLLYEQEHGVLPGPLYSGDEGKFTLQAYLEKAGHPIDDDTWVCPSNHGQRGVTSLARKESTYVVNNTAKTSPPWFFGSRSQTPLPLASVLAENPDGVWLIRDHDVFAEGGYVFDPMGSPGLSDRQRPPHAKGRNYFFADGRVKHLKYGAFPSQQGR